MGLHDHLSLTHCIEMVNKGSLCGQKQEFNSSFTQQTLFDVIKALALPLFL